MPWPFGVCSAGSSVNGDRKHDRHDAGRLIYEYSLGGKWLQHGKIADQDVYICPAGKRLAYHYTNEEHGLVLRRYWTNACQSCAIKHSCTTGKERRITRWEHEHVLEAVQRRLDEHPEKMRQRRETVEHPFGTIKARIGATHFLMKTLPKVATEMALHVLAYNLTRVMNIMGIQPLVAVMRA